MKQAASLLICVNLFMSQTYAFYKCCMVLNVHTLYICISQFLHHNSKYLQLTTTNMV